MKSIRPNNWACTKCRPQEMSNEPSLSVGPDKAPDGVWAPSSRKAQAGVQDWDQSLQHNTGDGVLGEVQSQTEEGFLERACRTQAQPRDLDMTDTPWALMSPAVSPQGTGSVCCSSLRELSVSRECLERSTGVIPPAYLASSLRLTVPLDSETEAEEWGLWDLGLKGQVPPPLGPWEEQEIRCHGEWGNLPTHPTLSTTAPETCISEMDRHQ